MSEIIIHDKIARFLDRKFRASKSYSTKSTYKTALNQFKNFAYQDYNQELDKLLENISAKILDPIDVLDDFFTYLTKVKAGKKTGYSNSSIRTYIIVAKEFLNDVGCKIYSEDLRQKFRLPKKTSVLEEGLTKEQISQILRLANYRLASVILVACSSGMRIGEIIQLKLSDIDFTTKPVTIRIRAETAKTREGRITHISSEASKALKDFLIKVQPQRQNEDYLYLVDYQKRMKELKANAKKNTGLLEQRIKENLETMSQDDLHYQNVNMTKHNFENQLGRIIQNIPELNKKSDNGRYQVHFHAFRYFFKTQVTDAHQSDFAESLMGHKSIKLVYYKQNTKARIRTYLEIEHALTISDTEQIDRNYSQIQEANQELKADLYGLSKKFRELERRIEVNPHF